MRGSSVAYWFSAARERVRLGLGGRRFAGSHGVALGLPIKCARFVGRCLVHEAGSAHALGDFFVRLAGEPLLQGAQGVPPLGLGAGLAHLLLTEGAG
jgi:hypothetical protein